MQNLRFGASLIQAGTVFPQVVSEFRHCFSQEFGSISHSLFWQSKNSVPVLQKHFSPSTAKGIPEKIVNKEKKMLVQIIFLQKIQMKITKSKQGPQTLMGRNISLIEKFFPIKEYQSNNNANHVNYCSIKQFT